MPDEDRSIADFRNDGTVRILLKGKWVKLRRPETGELWDIEDGHAECMDAWADDDEERGEDVRALCTEHDVDIEGIEQGPGWWAELSLVVTDAPKEWKRALRDLNKTHKRKVSGMWFDYGRTVFKTLGPDDALPDVDQEMDPALGSQRLYGRLIKHWNEVPLGSGGTST